MFLKETLHESCPKSEFFSSVFSRNWTEYKDLQGKSQIAGKCGPEKTANLDTLHAVKVLRKTVNSTPVGSYMFKVNNRNTRPRCGIC